MERAHEVSRVAARVTAKEARAAARPGIAEVKVVEAALRREGAEVAKIEWEREVNMNLEAAVRTLRGAESEEERNAVCGAVARVHEEVQRLECDVSASPQVVVAGAWKAAGGVVTT